MFQFGCCGLRFWSGRYEEDWKGCLHRQITLISLRWHCSNDTAPMNWKRTSKLSVRFSKWREKVQRSLSNLLSKRTRENVSNSHLKSKFLRRSEVARWPLQTVLTDYYQQRRPKKPVFIKANWIIFFRALAFILASCTCPWGISLANVTINSK